MAVTAYGAKIDATSHNGPLSVAIINFATLHGWVCFWCDLPVRRDVRRDHPLSPTREDIVPNSQRGGGRRRHRDPSNLVLAHKRCNHLRATIEERAFWRLMHGEAVTAADMWPETWTKLEHERKELGQ